MTKFETIATQYQYNATTKEEANRNFEYSCNVCCNTPRAMYKECDHCPISQVHNLVIAALADKKIGE